MDFKQRIEDIIADIVEDVIDRYVDEDDIREIVQYCRENGITTKSDFAYKCDEGGFLRDLLDTLDDGVSQYINDEVIWYEDGVDILNSTNTWDGWDYYFDIYGPADNVSALGVMVLNEKFVEHDGYDAIIKELYSRIEDGLN